VQCKVYKQAPIRLGRRISIRHVCTSYICKSGHHFNTPPYMQQPPCMSGFSPTTRANPLDLRAHVSDKSQACTLHVSYARTRCEIQLRGITGAAWDTASNIPCIILRHLTGACHVGCLVAPYLTPIGRRRPSVPVNNPLKPRVIWAYGSHVRAA
jgi:hypothetical protein